MHLEWKKRGFSFNFVFRNNYKIIRIFWTLCPLYFNVYDPKVDIIYIPAFGRTFAKNNIFLVRYLFEKQKFVVYL